MTANKVLAALLKSAPYFADRLSTKQRRGEGRQIGAALVRSTYRCRNGFVLFKQNVLRVESEEAEICLLRDLVGCMVCITMDAGF